MKVEILSEHGYREALYGLGLSHGKTSGIDFADFDPGTMADVAKRLAGRGGGHDKFLRMIAVILNVQAPLYWWKQMDTYKVSTVTQSESTMHTLMKHPIHRGCFDNGESIPGLYLEHLENLRQKGLFDQLNGALPQGWLQRRVVQCNYAVLRNILSQREHHKLREWQTFCSEVRRQAGHPELLG